MFFYFCKLTLHIYSVIYENMELIHEGGKTDAQSEKNMKFVSVSILNGQNVKLNTLKKSVV